MRALAGLVRGALLGVLLGAAARLLMRVVALGSGLVPEFHLEVTAVLLGLFALSGAGAALAGALAWRGLTLALAVGMSSAILMFFGAVFTVGEVRDLLHAGLPTLDTSWLLVVSAMILLLVVATPFSGWRAGRPKALRSLPLSVTPAR